MRRRHCSHSCLPRDGLRGILFHRLLSYLSPFCSRLPCLSSFVNSSLHRISWLSERYLSRANGLCGGTVCFCFVGVRSPFFVVINSAHPTPRLLNVSCRSRASSQCTALTRCSRYEAAEFQSLVSCSEIATCSDCIPRLSNETRRNIQRKFCALLFILRFSIWQFPAPLSLI